MKHYAIIEPEYYNTIANLDNIIKITITHDSDGNYTDIRFVAYEKDKDLIREYRITMNQNSRIMILDKDF